MELGDIRTLKKPWVVVMVGAPGSGKSTIAATIAASYGAVVLSADDMRERITGDAGNKTVNHEAWEMVYAEAKLLLARGGCVVLDGTHARRSERKRTVAMCKDWGAAAVVAMCVHTSLRTAVLRNTARSRQVPERAIAMIHAVIQQAPPTQSEGFTAVVYIDNEV